MSRSCSLRPSAMAGYCDRSADQSPATTGSGPLTGVVDRVRARWPGMGWCSSWCRTFHTEVSRWRAMAGIPTPETMSSWITLGSMASGGVPGRVKPSRRVSGGSQVGGSFMRPCARRKSTATVLSFVTSCGVRVFLIRSVHTPGQCKGCSVCGDGCPAELLDEP